MEGVGGEGTLVEVGVSTSPRVTKQKELKTEERWSRGEVAVSGRDIEVSYRCGLTKTGRWIRWTGLGLEETCPTDTSKDWYVTEDGSGDVRPQDGYSSNLQW